MYRCAESLLVLLLRFFWGDEHSCLAQHIRHVFFNDKSNNSPYVEEPDMMLNIGLKFVCVCVIEMGDITV